MAATIRDLLAPVSSMILYQTDVTMATAAATSSSKSTSNYNPNTWYSQAATLFTSTPITTYTIQNGPGTTTSTQYGSPTIPMFTKTSDIPLTVTKTTLQTSTFLPIATPSSPANGAAANSHESSTEIVTIAVPVSIAGAILIIIILLCFCFRKCAPTSYKEHRTKVATWWENKRERCPVHNLGWGIEAILTRWKETRDKNKATQAQRDMSEAGMLTGDVFHSPRPDTKAQKWRKARQRELEEARDRRARRERGGNDDDWAVHAARRHADDDLTRRIAEAEFRRIQRENTLSPLTPTPEQKAAWRKLGDDGDATAPTGGNKGVGKSPVSDGTTLVKSSSMGTSVGEGEVEAGGAAGPLMSRSVRHD